MSADSNSSNSGSSVPRAAPPAPASSLSSLPTTAAAAAAAALVPSTAAAAALVPSLASPAAAAASPSAASPPCVLCRWYGSLLSSPAFRDLAAGTVAGLVSVSVCHPLDTIRVRLQTAPSGHFRGVTDVIARTWRGEGPLAFYKGISSPLMAQALQKATMFYSFGLAKRVLQSGQSPAQAAAPLPLAQLYLCGAFGGCMNALVASPFELVRNRLQVQYQRSTAGAQYKGPLDVVAQLVRAGGVRSLWLGMGPMILRDAPGVGAWYATFEWTRRHLLSPGETAATAPKWKTLLAGASAGVGFWTLAFPQDTIKNLIQTRGMNMGLTPANGATAAAATTTATAVSASVSSAPAKPLGFFATGADLARREGVLRLWRGFPIAVMRGIPGAASVFLAYQVAIDFLNDQQRHFDAKQ